MPCSRRPHGAGRPAHRELQRAAETGLDVVLFFVVQIRDIHSVAPNDATHPAFGEALREAAAHGSGCWP